MVLAPVLSLLSPAANAFADVLPSDKPAVAVREPDRVFLIAITTAGPRLIAVGVHGVIILSDDDGKTWVQAQVPADVTITCVAFASPQIGWAAGAYGVVLHTSDGGQTWQKQLDGNMANQLILTNATVFAQANKGLPAADTALRRANIFMNSGPSKPFLTILVIDSQSAYVFGAYRMAVRTTDGGKSWADWSLNVGDPISQNLYGAVTTPAGMFLVGEAGMVFRSVDQGATFPQVTSPQPVTLFGICALASGRLIVYGVAGQSFYTDDQGKSWSQIATSSSANINAGIVTKDQKIVFVTEAGELLMSNDNGENFYNIPAAPPMLISDLAQDQDSKLILVGQSGIEVVRNWST